jgi:hypothetical protein
MSENDVNKRLEAIEQKLGLNWPKKTNILFVLDSSGSMAPVAESVISNFNEQLNALKTREADLGETTITVVVFGHDPKEAKGVAPSAGRPDIGTALSRSALAFARPLSKDTYSPSGMTPMYDAIGFGLDQITPLDGNEGNIANLVVIFTDGHENNSMRYNQASIAELIKSLKATGRWTFRLMGANINLEDAKAIMLGDSYTSYQNTPRGNFAMNTAFIGSIGSYADDRMRGRVGTALSVADTTEEDAEKDKNDGSNQQDGTSTGDSTSGS